MPTYRKLLYYSPNLSEESGDKLRNNFGGHYVSDEDPSYFDEAPGNASTPSNKFIPEDDRFSSIWVLSPGLQTAVSEELLYPSVKTPVLLIGDEDEIADDLQWQKMIMGGEYSTETYDGFYTSAVFQGLYCAFDVPYEKLEAKMLENSDDPDLCYSTIENVYQTYLQQAERKTTSIYEIPNYYIIDLIGSDVFDAMYGDSLKEYVSLNGSYGETGMGNLFQTEAYDWPAAEETEWIGHSNEYNDNKHNINEYYKVWSDTSYSDSIVEFLDSKMKNIIFDKDTINNTDLLSRALLPYYAHVNIPTSANNNSAGILDSIIDTKFNNIFLCSLKEGFVNNEPKIENITLKVDDSNDETINNVALSYMDMSDIILTQLSPSYVRRDDFFFCMSLSEGSRFEYNMLSSDPVSYRFMQSARTMMFNNSIRSLIQDMDHDEFPFYKRDGPEWSFGDFMNLPKNKNTPGDIVAYRVEKVGNASTDAATTAIKPLQNFFFISNNDGDEIDLVDTQVKYGHKYTYNVYAYKAVVSYRYKYSDFKVSEDTGEDEASGERCLGFYDPVSDEESPLEWTEMGGSDLPLKFVDSQYANFSKAISENKYVSEFILEIEPCIKIYEIPLYTRDIKITDNPPRQIDVVPFQRKDNSQVIGFYAEKQAFSNAVYPSPLNDEEEVDRIAYLQSLNLLSSEKIDKPSVSALRYVQVYRIDKKPESIKDFDENLIFEKDLKLKQSIYSKEESDSI
jgi:hypothetical protein